MLGKLIKHEFRATARIMGVLLLIVVGTAILAGVTGLLLGSTESGVIGFLGGLTIFAFVLALMASVVMSIVVMVQRFYKNILSDEGYLTLTLPANTHAIIWAKLIVSSVWFVATAAVDMLAVFIAFFTAGAVEGSAFSGLWEGILRSLHYITAEVALNGAAFILEGVLIVFLACIACCLLFYAAMAMGHGFARHKVGMSVLFFFVFQFATQIISVTPLLTLAGFDERFMHSSPLAQAHAVMWILIASEAVYCAAFYLVTYLNLKNRLNLE